MYTEPIALTVTEGNVTYSRLGVSPKQSNWIETVIAAPTRMTLRLLHAVSGKIKSDPTFAVDRHIVTFAREELNSGASNRRETASVNVTVAVPNSGIFSRTEVDQLIHAMTVFMNVSGNVDKLLRQEV